MYRLTSAALTVALLVVAVSGTAMATGPKAEDIASAKKVRETFGLRADTAYVRSSLTQTGRFLSTDWGVPLSSAELDDMVARLEVQASLPPAIGYASKQPSYGGAYIDQQDGGLPVFLFTENLEAHRQAIGQRLPADTRYGVRKVEHSLSQLTALKDLVSDRRKALLDESDVEVVSSSVDVVQNRVIVGIYEKNNRRTDSVKSLGEPMVVFDAEVPVTDPCEIDGCNNIKGGLVITQGGWHPTGTECTSGFIAKETSPSRYVMVTAGHCVAYYGGSNHCRYIKDMKVVNFDSWGGDSGGIVFEHTWPADNPTKLLGTHVHSKSTVFTTEGGENALRGWYSPVGKAVTELASRDVTISPCTTAGC